MAETVGVGVVSLGWMGNLHSRSYLAVAGHYPELNLHAKLIHAADTDEQTRRHAQDVLGFEKTSSNYQDVINDPAVDVVSVCAPNFLHAEISIAAAKAGKSVWIEKPVGRSVTDTEEIATAVAKAGVASCIGFSYRHPPAIEKAKELIQDGVLGEIANVRGAYFADYSADPAGAHSWRFVRDQAGSGVLGDLLGHLVDQVHYLVAPVSRVMALTQTVIRERPAPVAGVSSHFAAGNSANLLPVENEDHAALLVELAGGAARVGAIGTLEASRIAIGPRASYQLEIYGTRGSLSWNFERMNELRLAVNTGLDFAGYQTIMAGPGFGDFSSFQPGAGTSMGFDDLKVIEAKEFLQAHLGIPGQVADISTAVNSSRVLAAAEESVRLGAWQDVVSVTPQSSP